MKRTAPSEDRSAFARPTRRRAQRWVLGGVGVTALLLIVGLTCATVALLSPARPVTFVAVGSDYALNLSVEHNAHGWRGACDAHASAKSPGSTSLLRAQDAPRKADRPFDWADVIPSDDTPLVLYVSLHGGSDGGEPYVLSGDCTPEEKPSQRMAVSRLIQSLRQRSSGHPTLVVFDSTTSDPDWSYGQSENRFSEGLRGLAQQILATPGLVVLSASDVGQLSWTEDRCPRTIFADSFLGGLRGAAEDQNHNGRIDGRELLAYLQAEVAARAGAARGRMQTPLLLPSGEEGNERLAAIELAYSVKSYTPQPPLSVPSPREEIVKQWDEQASFRKGHCGWQSGQAIIWRRLDRLAVRREQLLLAGAESAANLVNDEIDKTKTLLTRAERELAPVTAIVGNETTAQTRAGAAKTVDRLLTAAPAKLPVLAAAALKPTDGVEPNTVRRLLMQTVVDRVFDDPVGKLRPAASVLRALAAADEPPADDSHLVLVLGEGLPADLGDPRWRDTLRLAITTRRASQGVFGSSGPTDRRLAPVLLPLLADRIDGADRLRLLGEDLLFCGTDVLGDATARLSEALAQYRAIAEDAAAARRALRRRNEAFELASYYADSVAAMRATSTDTTAEIEQLTLVVERAYSAAHGLGDLLVGATPSTTGPETVQQITAATDTLAGRMDQLRSAFRAWSAKLAQLSGPSLVSNREALLRLPTLRASDRLRLIELVSEASGASKLGKAINRDTSDGWRAERRRRVARLALAQVSPQAYDLAARRSGAHEAALASASDDFDAAVSVCARARLDALAAARLLARGHNPDERDRSYRETLVNVADGLRRLDRGVSDSNPSPLADLARTRHRELCVWRAERALTAGWSDTLVAEEPHFRRVALAALSEAENASPGDPSLDRVRKRVLAAHSLKVDAPAVVDVVTGATPPIRIATAVPLSKKAARVCDGVASVTVSAPAGFKQLIPQAEGMAVCPVGDTSGWAPTDIVLGEDKASKPLQDRQRVQPIAGVSVWFRGARIDKRVRLRSRTDPSVEIDLPPRPRGGGVAIVGPTPASAGHGAVAFVIDASGSMGPGNDSNSRYTRAIRSLQAVLRDLPAGVRVSVWVFGEAVGTQKTSENAESTIRRVLDPLPWDPADPAVAERLVDGLSYPAVEPWNESPLTRAILLASRDLHGVRGPRAVIAVTDGVDNRFADDRFANPAGQSIAKVVNNELLDTGVAIHVIAYGVAQQETEAARRQFSFIEQRNPPGRWWQASESAGLGRAMRAALQGATQIAVRAATGDDKPAAASATPLALSWPADPIPAGSYALPQLTPDAAAQQAHVENGDLLLLGLRRNAKGARLAPVSYTAAYHEDRPAVETPAWRVTLLSDRRLPSDQRSSLLAIERASLAEPLRVAQPVRLWIESSSGQPPLAWRRVEGYPASCWEVVWPEPQQSTPFTDFTVWWHWQERQSASAVVRREADQADWFQCVGNRWATERGPISLRRLALETRPLPTADGSVIEQPCLVIELRSEARCTPRLVGLQAAGERHQWFDEPRIAASVFWPVTRLQLNQVIEGIDLLLIDELKADAESSGAVARFEGLAPARRDDHRPTPAVGWFDATSPGLGQVGLRSEAN